MRRAPIESVLTALALAAMAGTLRAQTAAEEDEGPIIVGEKRGQWEEAARHWRHAAEVAPQEPGLLQRAELARRRAAERAQP